MNTILKFIEEHPALITICLFFLGGAGFLIKRIFFSKKEPNAPHIKAGRDISTRGDIIVGNKNISQSSPTTDKNIEAFEKLIENSSWRKELINHKTVYICDKNNTFQIEIGDYGGEWQEKWAKVYPDANASKYSVYLKINNTTIKQLTFISCDGERIFVPLPELQSEGGQTVYIWERDSLPYKICQIVGDYYIHKTIEGVARMSKISII
ncbi:MAG: hypothetical protein KJ706_06845 [Candidatus Omnitrophica bacterium]|nr:hypothetical protein [Candidatus Omnitrophota bacterium]